MGNAVQRDVVVFGEVVEPTEVFEEFMVGGVLVQIRTVAAVGSQDSQQRLHQGFIRAARVEGHILRQASPPPAPRRKGCGCPGDD